MKKPHSITWVIFLSTSKKDLLLPPAPFSVNCVNFKGNMTAFQESFSELEIAINLRNITIGKGQKENKSYLKILYQIFRFIKYGRSKGHSEHFPGIKRLAKNSSCSERSVQYFLNSQFFNLYGERIIRKKQSSTYRLNEWINRLFFVLERKGVMKNIGDNFDRFHRRYKKFMDKSIISDLEKGLSLQDVMNKLCTKKGEILHPSPKQYCTLAASLSKLAQHPQQSSDPKTKPVEADLMYQEFDGIRSLLQDRLLLSDQETMGFMFKNSLGMVKKAAKTVSSWLYDGYKLDHTAAALQKQINKLRLIQGMK